MQCGMAALVILILLFFVLAPSSNAVALTDPNAPSPTCHDVLVATLTHPTIPQEEN